MTDNTNAGVLSDAVRVFSSFLDRGVYGLLNIVYQVFFNITSVDLFQNEVMMRFYGRIQLILGVFMMFQLAMTVLKGIVDPNSFTDSKTGAGNLVYRVATSLILLTVLVPISTPGRNEFEKRVNNNGILFGTLYSLQYRILNNNTIGKLVLGTTDDNSSMVSTGNQKNDVEYSSRVFTATILRSFYRINLIEESKRTHVDGKEDEMLNANRMCQDIDDATLAAYTKVDAEAGDIVSYVNETCSASGGIAGAVGLGQKRYQFYYMAFVCPIIGIIFVVVFLSFCVDIAIRSVKLAVLRLIAPIPIISYMDPKGGKDNAFSSWVKTLTSTYLDLFIRLAAVYFVLFVIQDMIYSGVRINTSGGMVGAISFIMIWLGLFIFAKQAPKFIKQAIGLKEDAGGKLFGGLGEMLAAGTIGAGIIGGAISGANASRVNGGNVGKNILSGISGGLSGGYRSGREYFSSKDANFGNLMNKVRDNNAKNYSNASDLSTFGGRTLAGLQSDFGLRNQFQKMDKKISDYGAAESAWKRINTALDSDDTDFVYTGPSVVDSHGNVLFASGGRYSTKKANDLLTRMKSSGQYSAVEIEKMEDAKKQMQTDKFNDIRRRGSVDSSSLKGTEAQIFAGAKTIYEIGKEYANDKDEVFKDFQHVSSIADGSLSMGRSFKGTAYNAGRQADAEKNSVSYSRAKANAQRAEQSKK